MNNQRHHANHHPGQCLRFSTKRDKKNGSRQNGAFAYGHDAFPIITVCRVTHVQSAHAKLHCFVVQLVFVYFQNNVSQQWHTNNP